MATQQIHYSRVVDLSHRIHPQMPHWPGDPLTSFQPVAAIDQDGFFLRCLTIGEHSGTHMNAPNSFDPQGIGIDAYAIASLVVPAVVIDVRHRSSNNPDFALDRQELQDWEQQHGPVPAGSVVLLYTGWQEKWDDPQAFLNPDPQGRLHFPGFGVDACEFLLQARAIGGLGTDTHSVDLGIDDRFTINRLVLAQRCIVLENLTNLDQLPPTGTTLVIGRLKLAQGSGSPIAVTSFVP